MKNRIVLYLSFFALFSAIISLSCFFKIPIGPIPLSIQNSICILSGTIFGGFIAGIPTAIFLFAGLIGFPVYSGGTCGLPIWLGPTGGFLAGYLFGAIIAGLIAGRPTMCEKNISIILVVRISFAFLLGTFVIYIPGLLHFLNWAKKLGQISDLQSGFLYSLNICVVPYIPGDLIKAVICILVTLKIRPILAQYTMIEK